MRILELREELNLTQTEIAEAINTSRTNIGRWEKGLNEPTASQLIKLAVFFECSVDYLLGREDDFGNITVKTEKSAELTSGEQTLLANYKKLPEDLRHLAETYVKKLVSLHETSIPTRIAPVPKTETQPIPKKKTGISPA